MPAIPRVTVAAFANRAIASGMNHVGARGTDEQQRPCGDIGKVVVTQASVEAASYAGERLGRNGTVLEVAGMLDDGLMLRSAGGKVGFVPWDRLRDDKGRVQLAYGDALTTYTGQGSTVTEHIQAMPRGSRL